MDGFTIKCFARVGVLGNPSDNFHGKTLSVTIANYFATVCIEEHNRIEFVPHADCDALNFADLSAVHHKFRRDGYNGGLRLMQAACVRFFAHCTAEGIELGQTLFRISYDTNIPRQVGLAGSSCLVVATLKALMQFYSVSHKQISRATLASIALAAETEELGITAGLQDRVCQVYEGLVHMDFAKEIMQREGHGRYTPMSADTLPKLYLAHARDPSDSGRIHSDVKERWVRQDPAVMAGVKTWISCVDDGIAALKDGDVDAFADAMDRNFDTRRALYGDACLGPRNLEMVAIAREHRAAAKLCGSGGAVIVLCRQKSNVEALEKAYAAGDYLFEPLSFHQPSKDGDRSPSNLSSQS